MDIQRILTTDLSTEPNQPSFLRQPAKVVSKFDDELVQLIDDLIRTMQADVICVGLAAPQVGIGLQVAIVCLDRDFSNVKVLINPTNVIESGKKDIKRESCMSLPDRGGDVERRKQLSVDTRTIDGGTITLQFEGFEARVVAHEIDHLGGIMYSDKVKGPLEILDFNEIRIKLSS